MIKRLIAANRRQRGGANWEEEQDGIFGDFLIWRSINLFYIAAKPGRRVIVREGKQIEILRRYSGRVKTKMGDIKLLLLS